MQITFWRSKKESLYLFALQKETKSKMQNVPRQRMDKSMTYTSAILSGGYYHQHPTCPYCHSKLMFDYYAEPWERSLMSWNCERCQSRFTTPQESHFEMPCPVCRGKGWIPTPNIPCQFCRGRGWARM